MTQLLPSVSGGNVQTSRSGSRLALKCVLGVVLGLACLLMLMPGTSQAKGGSSRGGRSASHRSVQTHRQGTAPKHHHPIHKPKPKHKHKHKNDGDGDMDGGGDEGDGGGDEGDAGGDSAEAGGTEAGGAEAAEAAEAAEPVVVVYGMEITALYKGAASRAGLEIGDIILKVNGRSTPTFEALAQAIAQSGPQATLVVIREGDDADEAETVVVNPQNGAIGVSAERVRVE